MRVENAANEPKTLSTARKTTWDNPAHGELHVNSILNSHEVGRNALKFSPAQEVDRFHTVESRIGVVK